MEVKITREDAAVTAQLIGRLDTPASQEITPQMNALAEEAAGTIILDCSELSYISSSGLRILSPSARRPQPKAARL